MEEPVYFYEHMAQDQYRSKKNRGASASERSTPRTTRNRNTLPMEKKKSNNNIVQQIAPSEKLTKDSRSITQIFLTIAA